MSKARRKRHARRRTNFERTIDEAFRRAARVFGKPPMRMRDYRRMIERLGTRDAPLILPRGQEWEIRYIAPPSVNTPRTPILFIPPL